MGRSNTDAERRRVTSTAAPSLPQQRASGTLALRGFRITDPQQLDHGVSEGKPAAGRALAGMLIRRALMQTELNKFFSFGSVWSGADEYVVQLYLHAN